MTTETTTTTETTSRQIGDIWKNADSLPKFRWAVKLPAGIMYVPTKKRAEQFASSCERDRHIRENTQAVLDYFKGLDNEFYLLKGLLIADHKMTDNKRKAYRQIINTMMIAERMAQAN